MNKNPNDYSYKGDEKFEIDAREYMFLNTIVQKSFEDYTKFYHPERFMYVDAKTSKPVKGPKQEDIDSGKVLMTLDEQATFAPNNIKIFYDAKMPREMLAATGCALDIHMRNIEKGIAKTREELTNQGTFKLDNNAPQQEPEAIEPEPVTAD